MNTLSNVHRFTGVVLVLSFAVLLPALLMFWARQGHKGGPPRTPAHYTLERGLIAGWALLSAVGFVLFVGVFDGGLAQTLAVAGTAAYFFGSVLLAAAEILSPTLGYGKVYRLAASYVITAFVAQAVLGVAVLQSGVAPTWVGWLSIVWNLAGLVILPIVSRDDIYFPVLHSLIPLILGIVLLVG